MTEQQIIELGFSLVKTYDHDQFYTKIFQKGVLQVEFTYENERLVTCDLTIEEMNCLPITFEEIKILTEILGKYEN